MNPFTLVIRISFTVSLLTMLLVGCGKDMKEENSLDKDGLIAGENMMQALIDKKYVQLHSQFSKQLAEIVSLNDFKNISDGFIAGDPNFKLQSQAKLNGYTTYVWQNRAEAKGVDISIDENGVILGLLMSPVESHPETDTLFSEVVYDLPFNDEWYVYWGGHSVSMNYHYAYEHIRYAYDFVKIADDYSFSGDPLNNESYYTFNADVLAPADGKVVKVVNHIEDNIPGQLNEQQYEGNMVIIEHTHNEFSFIAHFKHHSIIVSEGDTVTKGQVLGKAGNSGNSSEPHIHFQVSKKLEDGREVVIPITFASGKQWVQGELAHN